jgi:flagellar motor switch protein FliG
MSEDLTQEAIDYSSLTKLQRLALFFITIGPEKSAVLLNYFKPKEVQSICKEISKFSIVDEALQKKARDEFTQLIDSGREVLHGGKDFITKALEEAQGPKQAAIMVSNIIPESSYEEPFMESLMEMDIRTIYNCIHTEQPQTIAFVVARLSTQKSVSFLKMLPTALREQVIERVGTMDSAPVEYIKKIIQTLKNRVEQEEKIFQPAGGVKSVADMLNGLPKDMSKELLMKIEEKNEILGKAVRRKMFSFDDLIRLQLSDLQRIMREVETSDLVIAMKPASPKLQQMIFSSVSKRAAETLKEEIQMLGPLKVKDIEAAQDRIIQTVRRLEEQGEITLDAEG